MAIVKQVYHTNANRVNLFYDPRRLDDDDDFVRCVDDHSLIDFPEVSNINTYSRFLYEKKIRNYLRTLQILASQICTDSDLGTLRRRIYKEFGQYVDDSIDGKTMILAFKMLFLDNMHKDNPYRYQTTLLQNGISGYRDIYGNYFVLKSLALELTDVDRTRILKDLDYYDSTDPKYR